MTVLTSMCDDAHTGPFTGRETVGSEERMSRCCPHGDEEHRLLATCQVVIHYPSEDYPCLCHGFLGDADVCLECDHPRAKHVTMRVCTPSDQSCTCNAQAI